MRNWILIVSLSLLLTACGGNVANSNVPSVSDPEQPTGELVFEEDDRLQTRLAEIAVEAKGKVGVFALLMEDDRAVSLNGGERVAMQSVVKLPVAMTVIKQAQESKLNLDQKFAFTTEDLANPNQRSPLRDKNPKGGEATVEELIRLAVSESDGTACDVLTRIAGGTDAVQAYIDSLDIVEMEMKRTHKEFGKDWDMQYENWATPETAVALLETLWTAAGGYATDEAKASGRTVSTHLSKENADLLLRFMTETATGPNRLKGMLPAGTVVAHKTGTGGTRDGITSATNDVGIITLPNGKHVAIAVFVGDSSADEATREAVIAKTAKAVWDTWAK